MLKVLDADGRLAIVDGDTDSPPVQREFERVIRQHTSRLNHEMSYKPQALKRQTSQQNVQQPNHDAIIEDLDNMPGTVPTISNHISLIHNSGSNDNDNNNLNHSYDNKANNVNNKYQNSVMNNNSMDHDATKGPQHNSTNASKSFRSMLEESEIDEA